MTMSLAETQCVFFSQILVAVNHLYSSHSSNIKTFKQRHEPVLTKQMGEAAIKCDTSWPGVKKKPIKKRVYLAKYLNVFLWRQMSLEMKLYNLAS